jgi:hypothetical protein
MKHVVESKIVCGGKLNENVFEINLVRDSLNKLTSPCFHDQLRNLSQDYRLFTWWCNLPVYDCRILEEFMRWINFSHCNLDRFVWNIFDHITYNFFCLLFHNYQFKLINNCIHSLEFSNTDIVEDVDRHLSKLYWVNNNAYCQNKSYYENNNFLIVFHLDRWEHIKPVLQNNNYIN